MGSLIGKVVIVTGASNGIGRAIAERLAHDGATVIVNYGKSADKAKQVVAVIEANGGKAVAAQADMSKTADARRLVKDTIKQFGRLDILVNNAGMFMYKPLLETTEEEFDNMFALNTKGPYFALQEAAKAPILVLPAPLPTSAAREPSNSSRKDWPTSWRPRGSR